ncbi:MAG TPA: PEGA domain-containing protein [Kofleriaceae bacterium]
MRGRSIVLGVVASLMMPAIAMAQDAPDVDMGGDADKPADAEPAIVKDPKIAKKWQQAGATLVKNGDAATKKNKPDDAKTDYENAVTAYTNALAASDDINVNWELATVNEKLGKLDVAAKHLRTIVTVKTDARADILKKATAKLDDISLKIAAVTLVVKPEDAAGATISLGGTELGKAPLPDAIFLMPGAYTFSFAADGFQPKDLDVTVEAGQESERTVELEPIKIIVAKPTADTDVPVPVVVAAPPSPLPMYVGLGVTGAAVITATITGIMAKGQHDTFVAADSTGDERLDAKDKGQNLALVTDIAIGTGIAAAGFTAGWYFFKYRPAKKKYAEESGPEASRAPTMTMVTPWSNGTAGGLSFGGSF